MPVKCLVCPALQNVVQWQSFRLDHTSFHSGGGQPQSKTLRLVGCIIQRVSVLECARPCAAF